MECRRYCDESTSCEMSLTRLGFINRNDDIRPRAEMAVPKLYELLVHPADGLGLAERANPKGQIATHVQDSRHYGAVGAAFHQSKIGTLHVPFDCFRSHALSFEFMLYRWNRWALFSFSLFTQSWVFFSCFRYSIFCSLFEGIWTNGTWWAKSRQQWWSFEATFLFMQAHIRHCFEFVDDETVASTINIHISHAHV